VIGNRRQKNRDRSVDKWFGVVVEGGTGPPLKRKTPDDGEKKSVQMQEINGGGERSIFDARESSKPDLKTEKRARYCVAKDTTRFSTTDYTIGEVGGGNKEIKKKGLEKKSL